MEKTVELLSLLYELSLTSTKHQNPQDTARKFIKKFLARKSLQYGAVWKMEAVTYKEVQYSHIYSMPSQTDVTTADRKELSDLFSNGDLAETGHSLFNAALNGKFLYFKLGKFGLLEFYDDGRASNFNKESFYPFIDVISQFGVNLESSYAFQNLENEIKLRQQAQKLLKSNEKKYRRIIDNIKLGLLEIDNDDIIQFANTPFLELTGYTLDEIIGKGATDVFIDKEDEEAMNLISSQNKRREEGKSDNYEIRILDKQGKDRWAIISGAPNYNESGELIGSIGIHLDITEEKKLREENEFKSTQLQKLFENSLDGLISIDYLGRVFEWSPRAEEIFGYSFEEIKGRKISETVIPHIHWDAYEKEMKNYLKAGYGSGLNNRIEIIALKKSGEEFPVELTIFPLKFRDKRYFSAFVRDITEIKKSKENMERALEHQKELNEMKSQFISMTSHELRTPLTTIKTNTELLNFQLNQAKEPDRSKLLQNVERVENNVERLNQLINNILIIGKLDSKKIPFVPTAISPSDYISKAVLPNYHEQGHQVELFSEGEQYQMNLDKTLFTHILNNLIENAIKYTPDKQPPEIHLLYADDFEVRVKDYGMGIPDADQKKLFDTFFRASNVGNIKGTGLGLAIVHEFVLLHKGTIEVESKESVGTTFIIKFPKK
ncbi:MAG: PAS domain-containing sensor histidine kinase [Ekhidna sp.]|nr:PAS domain-containing sensor histidine kinase [Ekhidna sp.]MBC6410262.1 PAS domain-containing sensor histidine kinase [Ekhidna sp.]MBC6426107.1 PAS domain-containing sensor histidine kinase [Ekhidna sp.]